VELPDLNSVDPGAAADTLVPGKKTTSVSKTVVKVKRNCRVDIERCREELLDFEFDQGNLEVCVLKKM
jgi:hypothetical protein